MGRIVLFILAFLLAHFIPVSVQTVTTTTNSSTTPVSLPSNATSSACFPDSSPLRGDSCIGNFCRGGIAYTEEPYCCYYYDFPGYYLYNFGRDSMDYNNFKWWYSNHTWKNAYYDYDNHAPMNGAIYTARCKKVNCTAKGILNMTEEIHEDCCDYKGTWYHHGQPTSTDDCMGIVCWNGSWITTNNSAKCCSNVHFSTPNRPQSTFPTSTTTESNVGMEESTTVSTTLNASAQVLGSKDLRYWDWISSFRFPWFYQRQDDNITWSVEYNNNKNKYYRRDLNKDEITYTKNCEKLVCLGKENVDWTGERLPTCCPYGGQWHHHGYPIYNNACLAQVCSNGSWIDIDYSDPQCCSKYDLPQYWLYNIGRDYVNYQRYRWWHNNYTWVNAYDRYSNSYNYAPFNGSLYTARCQRIDCTAKGTLNVTEEINEDDCCWYNNAWYHHGQPIYNDDCIGQVCWNGSWLITNYSDPQCCSNVYYSTPNRPQSSSTTTAAETHSTTVSFVSLVMSITSSTTLGPNESAQQQGRQSKTHGSWGYISSYKFPWWTQRQSNNITWSVEYYNNKNKYYSSDLGKDEITYTRYCEKLVCLNKDNVDWTGERLSTCCYHDGSWHHHGYPIYNNACQAQVCSNGTWIDIDYSDPQCCAYSDLPQYWRYNFGRDYVNYQNYRWWRNNSTWTGAYNSYSYYAPLNGSVYTSRCQKVICIAKGTMNFTNEIHEDCCEYNNKWYHHGQPIANDDCLGSVCWNNSWIVTNHSSEECCTNVHYSTPNRPQSTFSTPTNGSFMGMNMSSTSPTTLGPGQPVAQRLETKSHQEQWEWINSYRYPWWSQVQDNITWSDEYYKNEQKYFSRHLGKDEITYTKNCEKLVCVGKDNVDWTGEQLPTCCFYEGRWHHHGYPIYNNACLPQVCSNGSWIDIDNEYSDPQCCYIWPFPSGHNFDRDYVDYNRFRWWYDERYNYNYWNYQYFQPINGSFYTNRCQRFDCVGRDTVVETQEIHPGCCSYNSTWYHHLQPIYKDDCIGYVCMNGTWMQTEHLDQKCCYNPNAGFDLQGLYEDFFIYDYGLLERLFWQRVNETRFASDCQQVKCASRNNYVLTGLVQPGCNVHPGCDFNGTHYNHTERLPGCFQVFCAKGRWVQAGNIDRNCSRCRAFWDPHIITFDGYYYQYHGTCEYALAQIGTTTSPQFAVNSEFINCWGNACVGPSTFIDSPSTVIKMGTFGRYTPNLYKILVNGVLYTIPDNMARFVKEGATEHPVLAWRYRYGCIRLLGSSKIAVEKCGSSLTIWASPAFHGKLYGLCGYFDGNRVNDFTKRDGTVSPLGKNPAGNVFPDSWEVSCTNSGASGKRIRRSESGNCSLDSEVEDSLRTKCNQTVRGAGSLPEETISVMIDACVSDVCAIYKDTSGNSSEIDDWLGEVQTSVKKSVDVENKTTEEDVLPQAFFREIQEDFTPQEVAEDTGESEREKLLMRLMVGVYIGGDCWKLH